MELSLHELAALVGGRFAAEPKAPPVRGFATIAEAKEGDVTFFANPRYLPALKKCRATAALVPAKFEEEVPPVCIRVENPAAAFSELVQRFTPPPLTYEPGVHPTAVIGTGVELGENVTVHAHVVVESGARIGARSVIGAHGFVGRQAIIGEDCLLHPRVTIEDRCVLGHRIIIHSGAVLGSDGFGFELVDGRHVKIPQIGIVQVEDDVEIGANTTIDRARFGRTLIGRGTKIDNLVQIAHNVQVGEHSILVAQVGISGSTRLGNYVTLAGQVGVVGHVEIGDQVVVGAQGGVSKSLNAKEMYLGSPAVPAREYRNQLAYIRRIELLYNRVKQLEQELDSKLKSSPHAS